MFQRKQTIFGRFIARFGVLCIVALTGGLFMTVEAAPPSPVVEYVMTPGPANSHLIDIQLTYPKPANAQFVDLAIPAWRPGRYLIQNYARNVQGFSAADERGRKLDWKKIDKNTWRVEAPKTERIVVRYKVYANLLDAGSTLLNEEELYWNGTNVFLYVADRKDLPARLRVVVPPDWKIACPLKPDGAPNVFLAPDYDTLADAPGIASPTLSVTPFEFDGATYFPAFQGPVEYETQKLADALRKIVAEAVKIFGKAPYETYWFMYHSIPGGRWHGVEHLNSTSITFPSSAFADQASINRFYSLSSHEFFHVWNVKRIRPAVLGPFDYSKEVYTRNLWVAEGITTYYDDLLCKRAGLYDLKGYLGILTANATSMQTTPGRKITSVAEASFDEWLSPDDARNVEVDFYTKGSLLGLLLDLEVRRRTENRKSLDDVMRYLNDAYAKRGVGYPEDGVQKALEAVAGGSFADFFNRYVHGVDELPYNEYLSVAGLELIEAKAADRPEASLGITLGGDDKQAVIANVVPGEAGFRAGLDKNDILLALDGRQATVSNFNLLLKRYKPGDAVRVHVFRNGRLREFVVTADGGGDTVLEIRKVAAPTPEQQRVLASWLGEK